VQVVELVSQFTQGVSQDVQMLVMVSANVPSGH
jgi:hypothetical protein